MTSHERTLSLVAGTGAAVLYLATLSRWYSADSLWFALTINSADPDSQIDVYHLLLHPLGALWVRLWRMVGWDGLSIHALQALNALAGAGCVALVASIAARISKSTATVAVIAAGCAVSGGLWLLSTEAEDVTLGLVAHLAAVRLLLFWPAGGQANALASWGLGAAVGFAALMYANSALLMGVAILVHWQGRRAQRDWLRSFAAVSFGFVCLTLPVTFILASRMANASDASAIMDHILGGDMYGRISPTALPRGFYAFLRMLLLYPALGMNDQTTHFLSAASTGARLLFATVYVAVTIVAAAPVVFLWRSRHRQRELLQRIVVWAALFSAFVLWWVASDLEFWLPVGVAWWIALTIAIADTPARQYAGALLAGALLLTNGLGLILPHTRAERNQPLQIALRLAPELAPGDRVIASDDVHLFLRYFTGHRSIRISRCQLVKEVTAQTSSTRTGRLFLAGFALDQVERDRWHARAVFNDVDLPVWQLDSESQSSNRQGAKNAKSSINSRREVLNYGPSAASKAE